MFFLLALFSTLHSFVGCYTIERLASGDLVVGHCMDCVTADASCVLTNASKSFGGCCTKCKCGFGTTYYQTPGICVANAADHEGCHYRIAGYQYAMQSLPVAEYKPKDTALGRIVRKGEHESYFKSCRVRYDDSMYWYTSWLPLFQNGRSPSDILTFKTKGTHGWEFWVEWRNGMPSSYNGLVIRLMLQCDRFASCLMFKAEGKQETVRIPKISTSTTKATVSAKNSTALVSSPITITLNSTNVAIIGENENRPSMNVILLASLATLAGMLMIILIIAILFIPRWLERRSINCIGWINKKRLNTDISELSSQPSNGNEATYKSKSPSVVYDLPFRLNIDAAGQGETTGFQDSTPCSSDYYDLGYECPILKNSYTPSELSEGYSAPFDAIGTEDSSAATNVARNDEYQILAKRTASEKSHNYEPLHSNTPIYSELEIETGHYLHPKNDSLHYAN